MMGTYLEDSRDTMRPKRHSLTARAARQCEGGGNAEPPLIPRIEAREYFEPHPVYGYGERVVLEELLPMERFLQPQPVVAGWNTGRGGSVIRYVIVGKCCGYDPRPSVEDARRALRKQPHEATPEEAKAARAFVTEVDHTNLRKALVSGELHVLDVARWAEASGRGRHASAVNATLNGWVAPCRR